MRISYLTGHGDWFRDRHMVHESQSENTTSWALVGDYFRDGPMIQAGPIPAPLLELSGRSTLNSGAVFDIICLKNNVSQNIKETQIKNPK